MFLSLPLKTQTDRGAPGAGVPHHATLVTSRERGVKRGTLLFLAVAALALFLRLWPIGHGLPRNYVPDTHVVRNALGMAKDIPGPEMEAMLKKQMRVSEDTARQIALQRGVTVRDALVAKGMPSERMFLAAPKLHVSGEGDAVWTPRAQLSLDVK